MVDTRNGDRRRSAGRRAEDEPVARLATQLRQVCALADRACVAVEQRQVTRGEIPELLRALERACRT